MRWDVARNALAIFGLLLAANGRTAAAFDDGWTGPREPEPIRAAFDTAEPSVQDGGDDRTAALDPDSLGADPAPFQADEVDEVFPLADLQPGEAFPESHGERSKSGRAASTTTTSRVVLAALAEMQPDRAPLPDNLEPEGFTPRSTPAAVPYEYVPTPPEACFSDPGCLPVNLGFDRPDGLAPMGVLLDHTLDRGGQVLVTYRYFRDVYSGLRDGTADIASGQALAAFGLAPTHMVRETHLTQVEYGVSDRLTLVGQLPFLQNSIDFVNAAGGTSSASLADPGDLKLYALYVLRRAERQQLHINLGFSSPTGVFQKQNEAVNPGSPEFTYPLRTSSGTWDFLPGLTYRGQTDNWSWGAQALGTIRFGLNSLDYRYGNEALLNAWIARRWSARWSTSFRLQGLLRDDLHGADPQLDRTLSPTNRPDLQGGQRLDALLGFNYLLKSCDDWPGQYLGIEAGLPVYQNLHGPQLEGSWVLNVGWNLLF